LYLPLLEPQVVDLDSAKPLAPVKDGAGHL
jgi:hypothetical protein